MKKKILVIIFAILCVIGAVCAIYFPNSEINNAIDTAQNAVIEEIEEIEEESTAEEVIVSSEAEEIVRDTIQATQEGEDLSTTEVIESTEEEEDTVETEDVEVDESEIEADAQVEQENIAYEGDTTGSGLSLLGTYTGLTYYSQADSRWASVMYSSIGDTSQTMKSSACGPTSAAMVVSSSKGTILPTTMATLAVDNRI